MIIDPLDKFSLETRKALEEVFNNLNFRINFTDEINNLWWNGHEELQWIDYGYYIGLKYEIEKTHRNSGYKLVYQSSEFPEKMVKVLQYRDIQWNLFIDYFGGYRYNLYVKENNFFYILLFSHTMFNYTPIEVVKKLKWEVETLNKIKRIPIYESGELIGHHHISSFTGVKWDKMLQEEISLWLNNNVHFSSYYYCYSWIAFERTKDLIAFKLAYY